MKIPPILSLMSSVDLESKAQEAIEAALSQHWQKALDLNIELAKEYPEDVDTLNRLARAYFELGEISKAKENYNKVLKIDAYNSIAEKNLKNLDSIKKKTIKNKPSEDELQRDVDPDIFLEEAGKTKVINLEDLAMPAVLASLKTGDRLNLDPQRNNVIVHSGEGKRLGKIESTWSTNIAKAIRAGSKFVALVKSVQIKSGSSQVLSIFVKEIERSAKLSSSVFPTSSSHFNPSVSEQTLNILSEKQNVSEEESETPEDEEVERKLDPADIQPSSLQTLAEKEIEDDQSADEG